MNDDERMINRAAEVLRYCTHTPDMNTISYGLRSNDTVAICKRCGRSIRRWSEAHVDQDNVRHPVVWTLM